MDDILKRLHENGSFSFGSFVDGKLTDSTDYCPVIKVCENAAKLWSTNANRSSILKKISVGLRGKIPSFLNLTSLYSYTYRESLVSDLEYGISGFDYYSKLSLKNYQHCKNFNRKGMIGAVILEECALFSTLCWLTASPLAAGNTVVLLVKPSYSVVAICFACALHEFGLPSGAVNVLPFIESEKFPVIASSLPNLMGILPTNISSSPDFHFSHVLIKKSVTSPILVLKSADIDSVVDTFINLTRNNEVWIGRKLRSRQDVNKFFDALSSVVTFNDVEKRMNSPCTHLYRYTVERITKFAIQADRPVEIQHFRNLRTYCAIDVWSTIPKSACVPNFVAVHQKLRPAVMWFPNVIYVEEPLYDKFLKTLKFNATKYNAGREKLNEDGIRCQKVLNDFVNEKKGQGYEIVELIHRFSNCFIVVNDDFAADKSIIIDEDKTIHHVVTLIPVRTASEGVILSNNLAGLAVSLWSNDAVDIIRIPPQLQYGTVWVNCAALYCPSVPFSLWHSDSYGTFSGKRAFYENLTNFNSEFTPETDYDSLYAPDRNSIFPKKEISSVINHSLKAQSSWYKLGKESRLRFVENVAKSMNENWNTYYKINLPRTSEKMWQNAIEYLYFWSIYAMENDYQQIIDAKQCQVICKSEPLGIIAIIASSVSFEFLIFLITAALVHGNSVIVGLSSEEKSSVTATELEKIFNETLNLVNVYVHRTTSLWQQFIANEKIASVWVPKHFRKHLANHSFKKIIEVERLKDLTQSANMFEIYATKAKAVWLPGA